MLGRPIVAAPAQERFSDTCCRGPGRDPRTGSDALQIDRSRRNPRRILVGSSEASKLVAAATAVAAGIEQRSPGTVLGAEQPLPSPFVSHTRRCRRRRMTIQVAGAAAVRRRRLIDIYGCRTIHAASWLAVLPGRPRGCVCVCVWCSGSEGASRSRGYFSLTLHGSSGCRMLIPDRLSTTLFFRSRALSCLVASRGCGCAASGRRDNTTRADEGSGRGGQTGGGGGEAWERNGRD